MLSHHKVGIFLASLCSTKFLTNRFLKGDRIALTQIEQMNDGQYRKLGYYDTQADNLTWFDEEKWPDNKVNILRTFLST